MPLRNQFNALALIFLGLAGGFFRLHPLAALKAFALVEHIAGWAFTGAWTLNRMNYGSPETCMQHFACLAYDPSCILMGDNFENFQKMMGYFKSLVKALLAPLDSEQQPSYICLLLTTNSRFHKIVPVDRPKLLALKLIVQ